MADFNNGWGTSNSDWGNNTNTLNETNDNDQSFGETDNWDSPNDELDDLLSENASSDITETDTRENQDENHDENQDEDQEGNYEIPEEENPDEDKSENETIVIDYNSIKDDIIIPPQNLKNDAIFSEKDAYAVLNVKTVLDMCSEKMISWIDNALGIPTRDNARRAMAIVKLDHNEFSERVRSITTIKEIHEASIVREGEDPFAKIIEAMKKLEEINENQKSDMLSLLRKMIKSENVKSKKITTTRSSSDIDIVQDIRNVTTGEDSIREQVVSLGSVINTISKIVF